MRIFISWSGSRSHSVAILLRDWLKCVLQSTNPFVSSDDIQRGAKWRDELNKQLEASYIGIVCLTPENKEAPWILYEAGSLANGKAENTICTFLIDLDPADIEGPLAQFNHTKTDRGDILKLIQTINNCLDVKLDEPTIKKVFELNWPELETGLKNAIAADPSKAASPKRRPEDMIPEILESVRAIERGMAAVSAGAKDQSDDWLRTINSYPYDVRAELFKKFGLTRAGQMSGPGLSAPGGDGT